MIARCLEQAAWRDPLAVLASFADEPYALALISDGSARQEARLSKVRDGLQARYDQRPRAEPSEIKPSAKGSSANEASTASGSRQAAGSRTRAFTPGRPGAGS